jgi:diadenosine tetraphosphate (Ap4A) HIT family hydrolase
MTVEKNCPLCNYNANAMLHFQEYGKGRLDLYTILESENFLVKPDVLPGNPEGKHFLLHPKTHTYNYAEMHNYAAEIGSVLYEMERCFGPLVIFEHGGIHEGNSNQSVYHAHSHLYAGLENFDIIDYMRYMLSGGLEQDEIYPHTIKPAPDYAFLANLKERYNGNPYLYIEQGSWAIFAEDLAGTMKSQITQRSMHRCYSGDEMGKILNWKNIPECETSTRESVKRLAKLIDNCNAGKLF